MPPSIRPAPSRASSSALLSFLANGPTIRTTTSSHRLIFQRRKLSQTLPRRQQHDATVDETPPPPPPASGTSISVAGTGINYSSSPLSSPFSSSHDQHQNQHHQIPPPPPPSEVPRGFLSHLLHLIRSHPFTLSLSRRLLTLDSFLGSPYNRFISHPWRVLIATLKFLAFAHLFLEHVLSMAPASGPSMLPTFEVVGEWLVVSRFHKYGNSVKVGDLVVYQIPISTSGELGVKRIMGMPGDYVLVDTPMAGGGTVEGEVLGERPGGMGDDVMIQVPEGHCWVVGDNLTASRDSRTFGPVPLALIRGKVFAKIQSNGLPKLIRNPLERVELEEAII